MKILITGVNGQLGSQLINIIKKGKSELGDIDTLFTEAKVSGVGSSELDISNIVKVKEFIKEYNPDIIINSAAYTNVDGCESDYETAFKVNAIGARNLAIAAEEVCAKLIHISTDYVFQGDGVVSYREFDLPNPKSIYGKTKLLGESYIQQFCTRYFIIRTAWLYGYNSKNFVKTIIKAAREKGCLEVVDDQRGNPTNVEDLSYHILKIALTDEYGIYHCTGKGECSWYEFACKIVEYADIRCKVKPITSEKINRAARRPVFSSLDNMMLRCAVGDEMRYWEDALQQFIKNSSNNGIV